jgi:hypothetical protein
MPAINLQPYNTIALAASTAQQLVIQNLGHYNLLIFNLGPGNLFIKNDGSVAPGDAASFELPLNLSIAPLVTGGIWIAADAPGKCSVAVVPRQGGH